MRHLLPIVFFAISCQQAPDKSQARMPQSESLVDCRNLPISFEVGQNVYIKEVPEARNRGDQAREVPISSYSFGSRRRRIDYQCQLSLMLEPRFMVPGGEVVPTRVEAINPIENGVQIVMVSEGGRRYHNTCRVGLGMKPSTFDLATFRGAVRHLHRSRNPFVQGRDCVPLNVVPSSGSPSQENPPGGDTPTSI